MPQKNLSEFFVEYEKIYGVERREYAQNTYPKWRSGTTKMSGLVATRIIDLLPRFMPVDLKLTLVEKFWLNAQKYEDIFVLVKKDTPPETISKHLLDQYLPAAKEFEIPQSMKQRFTWLAGEDAMIVERLISEVKRIEASRAIEFSAPAIQGLLAKIHENEDIITAGNNTFKIGNKNVHLKYSEYVEGISEYDKPTFDIGNKPPPEPSLLDKFLDSRYAGWVIWGAIILFFLSFVE